MDFFYPNFNNDFWRMMGLVHFGDAQHFVAAGGKRFNYPAVVDFCRQAGLAFFDTASKVRRLKDNASDAFLEILEPTDVGGLLARLPLCHTVVTTGGKASEQLAALLRSASLSPSASPVLHTEVSPLPSGAPSLVQPPVADATSPFQGECALHSRSGRCLPVVASLLPHGTAADAAPLRGTPPLQPSTLSATAQQTVILSAGEGSPGKESPSPSAILSASEGSPTPPVILSAGEGSISIPAPGGYVDVTAWGRALRWWRMPSTSRAYPLALSAKAAAYSRLWE